MGGKTRTSWKKGQTGNPNGRPKKGFAITEWIRKELAKKDPDKKLSYLELFAMNLVRSAINGDPTARKIVMQYVDGMPVQKVDLGSSEGEAKITVEVVKRKNANK